MPAQGSEGRADRSATHLDTCDVQETKSRVCRTRPNQTDVSTWRRGALRRDADRSSDEVWATAFPLRSSTSHLIGRFPLTLAASGVDCSSLDRLRELLGSSLLTSAMAVHSFSVLQDAVGQSGGLPAFIVQMGPHAPVGSPSQCPSLQVCLLSGATIRGQTTQTDRCGSAVRASPNGGQTVSCTPLQGSGQGTR